MNGYNFTERVRKVLAMSREAAAELQHEYVGTEHMLLGLVREGEGVASTVLRRLDVGLKDIERKVIATVKRGQEGRGRPDLPYTVRAKKALELAMAAAGELNHSYVGTEHLLLGLIKEEKGIAAQVLRGFQVTPDRAHATTLEVLGAEGASDGPMMAEAGSMFQRVKRRVWRNSVGARSGFNFTNRLRQALGEARAIAAEMRHESVDTEHMLLSLIRESEVAANPQGTAIQALARCGVDPNTLRAAVLSQLRPGDAAGREGELPFSKSAKLVLEHAFNEARTLGHAHMGTEHALLGLLREDSGIAAQALKAEGLTMPGLRAAIEGIAGRATGEIETDGANLVVAEPSDESEPRGEMTGFSVNVPDPQALPVIVASLVMMLERQPNAARVFAEHGITPDMLRELAKRLNEGT